jgi:hypothetical protein
MEGAMPEDGGGRYRQMTDEGKTGDKIPGRDPSTAPLETDAEASGSPTPDRLLVREAAARHDAAVRAGCHADGTHPNSGLRQPPSPLPWLLVWACIILGAVGIVLAALQT